MKSPTNTLVRRPILLIELSPEADLLEGEPAVTALCHCSDCQKWSGSGTQSMVAVPTSAFKITKGSPKTFTTIGADSGKEHPHFFCGSKFTLLFSDQ